MKPCRNQTACLAARRGLAKLEFRPPPSTLGPQCEVENPINSKPSSPLQTSKHHQTPNSGKSSPQKTNQTSTTTLEKSSPQNTEPNADHSNLKPSTGPQIPRQVLYPKLCPESVSHIQPKHIFKVCSLSDNKGQAGFVLPLGFGRSLIAAVLRQPSV